MADETRTDPDAQAMRNIMATAALMDDLYRDPETRGELQKLIVKKHGDKAKALMPDFQARNEGEAVLATIRKERDEFEARLRSHESGTALAKARREIMEDRELRITEAELPDVEKLMTDETLGPIGSHRAAAKLYRSMQQHVAEPSGGFRAGIEWPTKSAAEEYKGLMEDPDTWARRKSEQVLQDIKSGNGARWGA